LIIFIAYHAHKSYLHAQFNAQFSQLDSDGALIIVDYKIKILSKKACKTKNEWFGKRGWTLHSVLIYTKNPKNNNLNMQAFDHWSGDTWQNGWFTASSLHSVIETLKQKSK